MGTLFDEKYGILKVVVCMGAAVQLCVVCVFCRLAT